MTNWKTFCPQKNYISKPPNFSGLDPETTEPWSVLKVVEILGIQMVTDSDKLSAICKQVIEANPKQAEIFRKGKTKIIGFFIKQVLDATKNRADPKLTQKLLEPLLRET